MHTQNRYIYFHAIQPYRYPLLNQLKLVVDAVEPSGGKTMMCHGKAKDDSSRFMYKNHEIPNDNVGLEYLHPMYSVRSNERSMFLSFNIKNLLRTIHTLFIFIVRTIMKIQECALVCTVEDTGGYWLTGFPRQAK